MGPPGFSTVQVARSGPSSKREIQFGLTEMGEEPRRRRATVSPAAAGMRNLVEPETM